MGKLKDDVLKNVAGGQGVDNEWSEWLWGVISNKLSTPLENLASDPTYGRYASCILQVIQTKGLSSYDVAGVGIACQVLKGLSQFQGDELALEYLEAINEFVIDMSKDNK